MNDTDNQPDENDDDDEMSKPAGSYPNHYYRDGQDLHFQPINHEEERELFRQAKDGHAGAREFLISNHLLFAMTFARACGKGAEDDELVSAANLALMMAIDRFDPNWDNRFTSFLKPFIKGEVARLWRSKNVVGSPRHTIPPTTVYLEDLLAVGDSSEESGDSDQWSRVFSTELTLSSYEKAHTFDFDDLDNREQLSQIWSAAREVLTENEMNVFVEVYQNGKSFAAIARTKGISREAVRTSHERGLAKLLRRIRRRK